MPTTERERQAVNAVLFSTAHKIDFVCNFIYKCVDGETFEAIACTEAGAFRVLNEERPGMLAELDLVSYKLLEDL